MYSACINISLKTGVLDTQGETVCSALKDLGFDDISEVRISKQIEIKSDSTQALSQEKLEHMSEKLLANPVIEDFEIVSPSWYFIRFDWNFLWYL